jgi:hypothetical protein
VRANTDWFRDARWGVFVHYLADAASNTHVPDITPDDWNRRIDEFDVDGLAGQLEEARAGYLFLTIGQNSGYYLAPNGTYDALVGHRPSRCSRRDLVADLIRALKPRGIAMMVYFTCAAPALDARAIERLKCTPPWDARTIGFHPELYRPVPGVDERMSEFQRSWEAVVREWSVRWGAGCRGWWFDGGYAADLMYRHADVPNFASFAAAAKAGNAGSLVAFNPGVKVPVICHSEHEDYTAGEIADSFPVRMDSRWGAADKPEKYWGMPVGRFVDGAQYHLLSFLGPYWGRGEPRFPDELVIGYTRHVNAAEGVMSWDVPVSRSGRIPDPFLAQLRALGEATRRPGR